jgi:hypothetical protein
MANLEEHTEMIKGLTFEALKGELHKTDKDLNAEKYQSILKEIARRKQFKPYGQLIFALVILAVGILMTFWSYNEYSALGFPGKSSADGIIGAMLVMGLFIIALGLFLVWDYLKLRKTVKRLS